MVHTNKGTVLITGASSGIGAETAVYLDSHNYQVYAGVRRMEDGIALQERASDRLKPIVIDVTQPDQIFAAREIIETEVGAAGLVALINNAGITVNQPLEFIPIAELRHQMEVNFIGQIAVTQAFMPLLRLARGRVIMMSSMSGRIANPIFGPYAASKHALEAAADALRVELRPWQMHVVVIEPGAIKTEIWQKGERDAEDVLSAYSDDARRYYGRALKRMLYYVRSADKQSLHPRVVAQTVEKAITARRPKARYVIGRDAYQLLALSYLPAWLRDRILAGIFGLR